MTSFKKLAVAVAAAAGALAALPASAAQICTGCNYTGDTWLGTHNPGTSDQSTFTHQFGSTTGAFTDWWAFTINPAGDATVNAIFNPSAGISNLKVELYSTTAPTACAVQGSSCASLTENVLLATGAPTNSFFSDIGFLSLSAGTYAFKVTGTIATGVGSDTNYSGNLNTRAARVPEPGTLALLGLGLLGATVVRRRRG